MQVYAEHLYAAWGLVQRGSPAAGVDGITTELFAGVAEEQIARIHRQLRREVYGADPVKGFFVPKKKNGEQVGKRLIGLSTVKDRILQRYLLQSIYPRLEATFTDSFVCLSAGSIDLWRGGPGDGALRTAADLGDQGRYSTVF